MYSEDDLVLISALQHLAFCPRQCALIHIEELWAENFLTAEGRVLHKKTHEVGTEYSGSTRIVRGLKLNSLRLGIVGVADVVEFHKDINGVSLPTLAGKWRAFPVEYKRGRPKPDECDLVQLCAQAICLEEMLNTKVSEGAIFYGQPRKRQEVCFDDSLRNTTEDYCRRLHDLMKRGVTPPSIYTKKCDACSLVWYCHPQTLGSHKSVSKYLGQMLALDDI